MDRKCGNCKKKDSLSKQQKNLLRGALEYDNGKVPLRWAHPKIIKVLAERGMIEQRPYNLNAVSEYKAWFVTDKGKQEVNY